MNIQERDHKSIKFWIWLQVQFDGVPPIPRVRSEKVIHGHKAGPAVIRSGVLHFTVNYDEICDWLADRWRKMEQCHATFTKQTFRSIRRLQEIIIQQVDSCRRSYFDLGVSHALHFNELLFTWQGQFNAADPAARTRVQFKELLHAQTLDFHKILLEDINACRVKDTVLHAEVMKSGWLEDFLSLIFNNFVGLIQVVDQKASFPALFLQISSFSAKFQSICLFWLKFWYEWRCRILEI